MLSALDIFNIGIGPSSSHTMGPMWTGLLFVKLLEKNNLLEKVTQIKVELYGSLALTGEGHGTILAVIHGLLGHEPKTVDCETFITQVENIKETGKLRLLNKHDISFSLAEDIILLKDKFLPQHPNGIRFLALSLDSVLIKQEYFSIGGGFVLNSQQMERHKSSHIETSNKSMYGFSTASEMFSLCRQNKLSIASLVLQQELLTKTRQQIINNVEEIITIMRSSIQQGLTATDSILPGRLALPRRAPNLFKELNTLDIRNIPDKQRLFAMVCAIAVGEANASFSRIVTAPTSGASGTIPGVLEYYINFGKDVNQGKLIEFILTAGMVGIWFKLCASISGAEVGCQGEIGVACSMAAAALTAVLGGSLAQIERAAVMAMEHCLGMTCDPVDGLVQIPCIERNGVAAGRAIDIANLALLEDAPPIIGLDQIIQTMLQTGKDMNFKYKETSLGGLAVNFIHC